MPPDTRFWFAASTEEFAPTQMLEQARAAERAGFDGLASSDHFAPWFPEGKGSQAWIFLAALGQLTSLPLGTSVTPIVHHYQPGLVAQAFMSLEELYPGRVFLGAGSGEALNEVPLGCDWPAPGEQVRRLDEGLEAIRRLWDGETVTMDAGWFRLKEAKLYTRARGRPRLYVSAFGAKAARVAAKHGDGLWTLGDPQQAPEIVAAYRDACAELGREPGEVILQAGFHLAADEQAAIASAKKWKPTQMPEVYREDIHDPAEMVRMADRRMSDEQFAHDGFLVGADAGEQVERLREMRAAAGASVICLQLIGDADPLGSIRRYGEEVLPALGAGQGASGRRYSTSSRPSPATSSAAAESRQPSRS
jgi:coenzyme F420-dependent glucose-6-phosphate dehydrogenase